MNRDEVSKRFKGFLGQYPEEEKDEIWRRHSSRFREFWTKQILDQKAPVPSEAEIDQIVRILDRNGKGNKSTDEAVARAMTPQGVWRRLIRSVRDESSLRNTLNGIFTAVDGSRAGLIDKLYKENEGRKNNLTGKSGNVVNALSVAYSPFDQLSVISLNDRKRLIEAFGIPGGPDFEKDSPGKKMVQSNKAIIDWFRSMGVTASPRTISKFLYSPFIKDEWKGDREDHEEPSGPQGTESLVSDHQVNVDEERRLFYLESQLEDFLIENWDHTELGKKLDLIEENGEVVSQQYPTDIGKIDILAQDKKTKQFVVIELKRGQTSDDTVGQLMRYMGWLEAHKTNGAGVRGIIIAGEYDQRLYYALKMMRDTEVYLYRVDFKLEEFKKR